MKKWISVILAMLLVLTPVLSLQAAAERHNGPLNPKVSDNPFAISFTFLSLLELNEDGSTKYDEDDNAIDYVLFRNFWDEDSSSWKIYQDEKLPEGVAYDFDTNTLTLTNFNGSNYMISSNMMGDDLKIKVNGACSLEHILVWGDGWGAGLRITGSGSLTVNEKKIFDHAIDFHPEGTEITFGIDKSASVKLYGKEDTVAILGTVQTENIFDLPDGAKAEPKKDTYVEKQKKRLYGYSISKNYYSTSYYYLGTCKDDPDGIYTVDEVTYYPDGVDKPGIPKVDVTHYYYTEKYDFYLEDHEFGDELGHSERVFDDLEAAKAAGFEQKRDENGDKILVEMKTPYGSGTSFVVIGPDGKEYASTFTKKGDGDYGDVLADIEPLPGVEDMYLFVVRDDMIDIDPDTLEPVTVDVTYDGVYTWSIPGNEFIYEGTGESSGEGSGVMLGDVDGDGQVLAGDARYALRAAVNLDDTAEGLDFSSKTNRCFVAADITGDKNILAEDARLILRAAVGLCDLKDPSTW